MGVGTAQNCDGPEYPQHSIGPLGTVDLFTWAIRDRRRIQPAEVQREYHPDRNRTSTPSEPQQMLHLIT